MSRSAKDVQTMIGSLASCTSANDVGTRRQLKELIDVQIGVGNFTVKLCADVHHSDFRVLGFLGFFGL